MYTGPNWQAQNGNPCSSCFAPERKEGMILTHMRGVLCALALAVFPGFTKADVIFSDFGPGNTYSCCLDWGIGLHIPPFSTVSAMAFTPSSNFDLSQINLGITWVGNTNSVNVSLETDSAGLPGTTIESWTLTNLPPVGSTNLIETISPVSTIELRAWQQYWIAAAGVGDASAVWNWNIVGATGAYAQSDGGSFVLNQGTLGAFDVLGAPVPEPSSFWLLGTVVIGLALWWHRQAHSKPLRSRLWPRAANTKLP